MNKILILILFFILVSNCSLNKGSGVWSKDDKKVVKNEPIAQELFKDDKNFIEDYNLNIKIRLDSKPLKNSFINYLTNNEERIDYDGTLKRILKYKFSKIDNFNRFEPDIVFNKKNLIFFDNKGSILKFDSKSKLIWKKNYYTKSEKKLKPMLSISSYKNYLVIVDNLAKYYALDIKTGNLIWMQNNIAPFNSQIKIFDERIFVIDFKNVLRCYSLTDGKEFWSVKTDNSFVKSQKKLSLVIFDKKVFFNNTLGDVSAVDIYSGKLIWQTPTQASSILESSFQLKTSDLVIANKRILVSNNKNEFYSLDIKTGTTIWKKRINSSVKPTVIDNLIFTVSESGFLIIFEANTGDIVRITNVFDKFKEKKIPKINPIGFFVGNKNVYLTTSNGRLIVIDILNGKSNLVKKIDSEKISRPFILDKNLFIIKNNAILKFN